MTEDQKLNFLDVYNEHNAVIYKFIFIRTNGNKETAEDLTQEVFYKALRKFQDFNPQKAGVKTWLFKIARNTVIDFYRSNKQTMLDIEQIPEIAGESKDEELLNFIFLKINLLKDTEKEIVIYKYVHELSEKDISEIIGKNYIATRVMVSRTLTKLKTIINEGN